MRAPEKRISFQYASGRRRFKSANLKTARIVQQTVNAGMGLKEAWHELYFGNRSKLLMSWMPDLKFSRTALPLSPTKSSGKPWLWPGFKRVDHVLRVTGSDRDSINVKPKSNLLLGAGRVFWGGSYWARLFFFVPFGSTGGNWFSDEAWYATLRYFFHAGISAKQTSHRWAGQLAQMLPERLLYLATTKIE